MDKTALRTRTGKAVLLTGLCFSALLANAATISVDCDAGNTVTAALSNIRPGDTVLVSGAQRPRIPSSSGGRESRSRELGLQGASTVRSERSPESRA